MWQHFFEREKKILNPYIMKLNDHKEYIMYDKEIINSYKNRWNEYFKNDNLIYLEIGCGAGNFTIKNSVKYPNRNYLAVELRFKRLVLASEKATKRDLKNLVFLRQNGNDILNFIGSNEIDGIYINFPDPWEKKVKNRIIQPKLFELTDKIMKKNGKIFFKTDHYGYYLDVLEKLESINNYKILFHTDDLHNSIKKEDNLTTEFEDLFLKQNLKINYIEIEKEV